MTIKTPGINDAQIKNTLSGVKYYEIFSKRLKSQKVDKIFYINSI